MKIVVLAFVWVITMSLVNPSKELFVNESKLSDCRQNIPLTYYGKGNDIEVAKKAKELEGQQLILLHFNKKNKSVTFKRYYLVSTTHDNGHISNYLVEKNPVTDKDDSFIFIKYSEKVDRFYTASCFDKVLSENADLKALLQEVK